jgi:glycosyltransferase involved in cell wall biosynthesis
MTKMAQIIYSGLGGHGSVAFSLIHADKKREWQPLMGFFGVEPLSPAYADTCQMRNIPFKYFFAISGKSWRAWPRIFRWLADCSPEAIVLHSVTALLPCLIYAHWRGAPVVVVEHQSNALKKRIEWVFGTAAMLLADKVVVLTPGYDLELKARLGVFYRASKVRIIPNGVDVERFAPHARPVNQGGSVLLGMAARFTRTKRQDVLIDALAELRRCEPDIDWRLSLAGDGEAWEDINRTVRAKGLDAYVSLPGLLTEAQLIDWYHSIDIYLHASEGETLSTSLLQAMASALPIVASDVPGISNLLCGGETVCGVLVEGQSPAGFAEAVIELVREPKNAANLASSGRRLVVQNYSHDLMFSRYTDLLRKK